MSDQAPPSRTAIEGIRSPPLNSHVLVIAGTDSSGGAGLVRDVQAITEFGARASCVVTAVTAQTNSRVEATCTMPPEIVRQQLRAALHSSRIGAIKIGMLGNGAIVRALLDELPDRDRIPIIVDPVLCSSSGTALLDAEGVQLLQDRLLPRCTLVTPNLIEAGALLAEHVAKGSVEQTRQAEALLRFGSQAVLLKGGHGIEGEALDVLAIQAGSPRGSLSSSSRDKQPSASPILFRARRLNVTMRGTGCALSSAIASLMASGLSMEAACQRAKAYLHDKLAASTPRDE